MHNLPTVKANLNESLAFIFALTKTVKHIKHTKGVAQRCSAKKVFFKVFQNSLENICIVVSFLIKL